VVDPKVTIGMNDKEIRAYSLVRAMRKLADGHKLDGIEREASDATAKICRKEARGFFIPQDVMLAEGPINPELYRAMRDMQGKRTLSVMTSASGGFLVDTEVMGGSLIELLRNKPYVAQLGATTLTGLVGNVAIPRVTGGATTYWLSESGQVTAADQAFGQLGLVPHRLVADTAYTKELLMQASIDIEAFVRNDLMTVLAIEKDRASLFGQISSGNAGEPLGIFGNTGIGSVTFGAAATWAKVLDFETQVATANALLGAMAYLTSPGVRAKWKAAVKIAGSQYSDFLWQGGNNLGEGQVNGYKAVATNQIPATGTYAHRVVFGNWADLILAEWAGIDVVVDPYSLKKQGQIEVTITLWTDIGVRHAGSFTISADSGAQ
jgi:HK97 family phage major capsid protein